MTDKQATSSQYQSVCQANKIYYQQTAAKYDATETCVVDGRFQEVLERDLKDVMALVRKARGSAKVRVLDACGGSGNVSLKLSRMDGVDVTLCDQSQELISIFQRKCKAQGSVCEVVNDEISHYLASAPKSFDLIVFSSALHHLEDYGSVLKLAAGCLNAGGFIFTVFDPIQWKFPARHIVLVEHIVFKIANKSFFPTLAAKMRRVVLKWTGKAGAEGGTNWGKIAEYHVDRGIDDLALAQQMQAQGLKVVWHVREPKARYSIFESMLKMLNRPTTFKLLFQK